LGVSITLLNGKDRANGMAVRQTKFKTGSSAIEDDHATRYVKSCQLLHNCTKKSRLKKLAIRE